MRRAVLPVLLALLASAPAARAYHVNGPAWPGHRITYWNGYPGNPLVVARAVRAWNESGAAVRFVPASSAPAELRIVGYGPGCQGLAARSGRRAVVRLSRGGCRGPDEMARVAAHELGHVLGLGHEDRFCATMNSKDHDLCSLPRHDWQWRCRLLEPDDVRGAVRIYGGFDLFVGPPFCDRFPAVRPPGRVAASFDPARGIVVTWRNVADLHLANLSGAVRATCPLRQPPVPRFALPRAVAPGRPGSFVLAPRGPGPACVALWSEDEYGRLGPPALVRLTVSSLPPVAIIDADPPSGWTLTVHGQDSRDPDGGPIAGWAWDFGDGTPPVHGEGGDATHAYRAAGTYTVSLAIVDDEGMLAGTRQQVRVP